jgi:hypothetical protein
MLLLIDTFSINKGRGYENPSLEIIVTERCSTGGCPLEEACEHFYLNQSVISVAISYIISVYCEDYAGYFTVILSFLAFHLCSAYFIYLVSYRFCFSHVWIPFLDGGGVGGLPPHIFHQGVQAGFQGNFPQRDFFWENFLVKYHNFIVNIKHSSLGCRSDGRRYVRVVSLEGNPLLCMR